MRESDPKNLPVALKPAIWSVFATCACGKNEHTAQITAQGNGDAEDAALLALLDKDRRCDVCDQPYTRLCVLDVETQQVPNFLLARANARSVGILPVWSPPAAKSLDSLLTVLPRTSLIVRKSILPEAVRMHEMIEASYSGTPWRNDPSGRVLNTEEQRYALLGPRPIFTAALL